MKTDGPNACCTPIGIIADISVNERAVWSVDAITTSITWNPVRIRATGRNTALPRASDLTTSERSRVSRISSSRRDEARSLRARRARPRCRPRAVPGGARAAAPSARSPRAPIPSPRTTPPGSPGVSSGGKSCPSAKRTVTRRGSESRIFDTDSTAARRPSRMTATRSHVLSTSDSTCDDRNTVVRPSRFSSAIVSANASIISGSRPAVGSSRMATLGRVISAWTMPSFRLVPCDRSRIFLFRSDGPSVEPAQQAIDRPGFRPLGAERAQIPEVVRAGQFGVDGHLAGKVADQAPGLEALPVAVEAADGGRPAGGTDEVEQQPDGGGLARAVRPEEPHHLAVRARRASGRRAPEGGRSPSSGRRRGWQEPWQGTIVPRKPSLWISKARLKPRPTVVPVGRPFRVARRRFR